MPLLRFGTPGVASQSSTVQHSPAQFWTALLQVPKLEVSITFSSHLRLRCFLAFRNRDDMSLHILMSIPSWLLVSVGERRSQPPGVLSHTRPTRVPSPMEPQVPGVTPGSPLCSWCCGHSSWGGARHTWQDTNSLFVFCHGCR